MALKTHWLVSVTFQTARIGTTAMLVWVFTLSAAMSAPKCLSESGQAAVEACQAELRQNADNTDVRIALSEAFISLKQYEAAVAVLRQGFEHFPGDERIKKKLLLAESFLEEQQWIEKQQKDVHAASPSKKKETQTRLNTIRCRKLKGEAALAACNKGLSMAPENGDLLTGRGMVWLAMGESGRALLDFKAALAANPKHRDAAKSLRLAQTKRKVTVAQCINTDGPEGLKACNLALAKGASDEPDIQKRIAVLFQTMGKKKEAIKAYQAAVSLNPADEQSVQALAKLQPKKKKAPTRPAKKAAQKQTPKAIISAGIQPPSVEIEAPVKAMDRDSLPSEPKSTKPKIPAQSAEIKPDLPAKAATTRVAASPKIQKAKPAQTEPPQFKEPKIVQPGRYSNKPEMAGITH